MKHKFCDVLGVASILGVCALVAFIYPEIPEQMPIHWNGIGVADGYLAKPLGVTLLLSMPALVFLLLKILPIISPHGFRMENFQDVTDVLILGITVTLSGMGAMVFLVAAGHESLMNGIRPLLLGGLFIVIGGCLNRTTRNFFIGIRTPWTLASDSVWASTHRIAGRLFLFAGTVTAATVARPAWSIPILLFAVSAAVVIPVIYSFFRYRKLHGFKNEPE